MESLVKGRYTMVLINSLGLPIARKINLERVEDRLNNFGRKEGIKVFYKEKGRRKLTGFAKDKDICFIIGWKDIKGCFNTEEEKDFISCNDTIKQILDLNNINENDIVYMI